MQATQLACTCTMPNQIQTAGTALWVSGCCTLVARLRLRCRAGLEYLRCSGQQPHILHLHEWQTSAAAMLYWEVYSQLGLYRPRVVLTIHNLDNTGECRQDEFTYTGVLRPLPGAASAAKFAA